MGNWTQPRRPADKPAFPEFEEWANEYCPGKCPIYSFPCSHNQHHRRIGIWGGEFRSFMYGKMGEEIANAVWTSQRSCREAYEKHKEFI